MECVLHAAAESPATPIIVGDVATGRTDMENLDACHRTRRPPGPPSDIAEWHHDQLTMPIPASV